MAASQRSIRVGIIAEDHSDVDVLRELLPKIARRKFGVKRIVGRGCGNIKSKARAWSELLRARGCSVLIVLHDLDGGDLTKLRGVLVTALSPSAIKTRVIVIAIQEIEAWLLSDSRALRDEFKWSKQPKCPSNPESIAKPKEKLRDIIWKESGKVIRYLNTVHNVRIAKRVSLECLRKCSAFLPLEAFWRSVT